MKDRSRSVGDRPLPSRNGLGWTAPPRLNRRDLIGLRGLLLVAIGGLLLGGEGPVGPAGLTLVVLHALSSLALLLLPRGAIEGPSAELALGAVDVLAVVAAVQLAGTTGMLVVSCLLLLFVVALAGTPVHASAGTAVICALHTWLVLRAPAGAEASVVPQLLFLASNGLYFGYLSSGVHVSRRHVEAERRERAEMECLVEILGAANSSLDVKQVAFAVVTATSRTVPMARCSVLFIDDGGERGYVIASHDDPSIDRLEINLAKYPEVRKAIQTRKPVLIRDVATDPVTLEVRQILSGLDLRSIMVVPLVYGDHLMGTICMRTSRAQDEFTDPELRFCLAVARACANGLKNAMLHEQLREESARQRRLAEKLSRIFEHSPELILTTDNEHRVTEFNPAAERLLGYTKQEVLGWPCASLFPDGEARGLLDQVRYSGSLTDRGCRLRRKDGRRLEVEMSLAPLKDEHGAVTGTVWLGRDLTELRATHTQLLQTKKLSTIGEVISGVAHELNNPLSGVLGFAELLLLRELEPQVRQEVALIQDAAQRCQRIVHDLLAFTREGKGERRHLNVNEIINSTLDMKKYQLHVSSIEVARELDPHLPKTVIDAHPLQQVLLNLIHNAQQALARTEGTEPRRLLVRSAFADGNIRIEVTDNGEGMSEETLRSAFDPFFTTREPGRGAGLGLTLSRSIVMEHGGRISARSSLGHGSTFTIELPVRGPVGMEAGGGDRAPAPIVRTGSRILVVDDEPVVLQLFVNLFEGRGYKIDTALCGREACEKVDRRTYDLVITDVRMPGMSGLELYPKLLDRRPELRGRVIFITGDVGDREVARLLSETGVRVMTKPIEVRHIVQVVDDTLADRVPAFTA